MGVSGAMVGGEVNVVPHQVLEDGGPTSILPDAPPTCVTAPAHAFEDGLSACNICEQPLSLRFELLLFFPTLFYFFELLTDVM